MPAASGSGISTRPGGIGDPDLRDNGLHLVAVMLDPALDVALDDDPHHLPFEARKIDFGIPGVQGDQPFPRCPPGKREARGG